MKNNSKTENELIEQEAPLKNTDKAFVRVDKDGHPEMPGSREDETRVSDKKTPSDHPKK